MNFEEMKQKYNYYENKHGILFNCDCMKLMETIPDKYFELSSSEGWVVWDKGQRNFSLADCELAYTSFERATRIFEYSRSLSNFKDEKIHPTQKPVALYCWLLQNYAKTNDKIFDSHVGSASSFIACMQLGFNFTGSELDNEYFNESVKRIKLEEARIENKFYLSDNSLFDFEKDNT